MIPLRLELKNFMSYGEDVPVLDLSGMHTLCLSGENGHGKSALLDAMTWALWGESRAGKNKHDDLVRIGADEMSVQFTFAMDNQTYRVLRKRSRRAGGNQWELQQRTPEEGWRSLTGNNAGETERAIQKLLRMSYDTFLNSAYLRQGQADQFVRQPPGKRKEILADILDLSRYDQLEAKARERMREEQAVATDLERDISGIDAELEAEAGHREALEDLTRKLDALNEQQNALKAEWDTLRLRRGFLEQQKQFAEQLQREMRDLDAEIKELDEAVAAHLAELERCKALLDEEEAICRDYEALQVARQRWERLEEALGRWNRGQRKLAETRKEWLQAQYDVQRDLDRATRDWEDAGQRLQDYDLLQKDRAKLADRLAVGEALEQERQQVQTALVDHRALFSRLEQDNARLSEQIRQWEERLAALARQQGTCAVCDAPLSPERAAETQVRYQEARDACLAERRQVRQEAGQVKTEIAALEQQGRGAETRLAALTDDRVRLGQVEQRLLELDELRRSLPGLAAVREQAARRLQTGDFAPELHDLIARCESALAKLEGVEAEHEACRAELAALAAAERRHLELAHARTRLTEAQARLAHDRKTRQQRQENRADRDAQRRALADGDGELDRLETRLAEIKELAQRQREEERAMSQEAMRREQALERCETLRAQRTGKAARLAAARTEAEIHEQLMRAFGKKGVQALIIENALPELQEEANRLLERLTDGDMSLFIDTLREARTKRDAPIETLDIKVSDSMGTRPLEMYSGGEGFRAAFALRIALSKLLARRAGAKLQTLIIDEGFGTQDGKGREKLIEAIQTIQDDFARIIVITHIDELRDAFPTRVEVIKTPSGSQITVLEGAAG